MTPSELDTLLRDVRAARVAVIGDVCLDVCWFLDSSRAEKSVETGLTTQPVRAARSTPGGATNVAANLAALGAGRVRLFGVLGADVWGETVQCLLEAAGVDISGCLVQGTDWATQTYVKPHLRGAELSRFDFGNYNHLHEATEQALLERIAEALPEVDAIVVNQQAHSGIHTPGFRAGLLALMERHPDLPFLADTRSLDAFYPLAGQKMTVCEAMRLCGLCGDQEDASAARAAAEALFARCRGPVVLTRNSQGCLVRDAEGLHAVPAVRVCCPTDTTGAGDVFLAGLASGIAAGRPARVAAELGALSAAVTVRKIHEAGVATAEDVRTLCAESAA